MLVIRSQQMKAFEDAALRQFEKEVAAHITEFVPRQAEIMGDEAVLRVVRTGLKRAFAYGLTRRGPVRFYVDLMFMLGSDFDTDPQYPWSGEILREKGTDQMEKEHQLYNQAMCYFEIISGPDENLEKEAIIRASHMRFEDLPASEGPFVSDLNHFLHALYPEKCDFVGESAIRQLIREAEAAGRENNVTMRAGISLIAGLMFAFGHGCPGDPQFPWIAGALSDHAALNQDARIRRLHSKAVTYFSQAAEPMERE